MRNKFLTIATAVFFSAMLLTLPACKKKDKDEPAPNPVYGQSTLVFNHVFGSSNLPFSLNKLFVHPKTGDTLTFTTFKYYVSNLKLKNSNGNWWSQPESYHLLDLSDSSSLEITIQGIPAGTYTMLEYTLGVDSQRNVSGMQTGDLDPSKGMYWDMNKGYIMVKAEGSSPQAAGGSFVYHLGGFSGVNNIVTVKSTSTGNVEIGSGKNPKFIMQANTGRLWHTLSGVGAFPSILLPGADAKQAAGDFFGSVVLKSVEQ